MENVKHKNSGECTGVSGQMQFLWFIVFVCQSWKVSPQMLKVFGIVNVLDHSRAHLCAGHWKRKWKMVSGFCLQQGHKGELTCLV